RVEWFLSEPPDDTRAFLRAQVLRRFGDQVHSMDWDHLRFRWRTHRRWYAEARLDMPAPARLGRDEVEPILDRCQTTEEHVEMVRYPIGASSTRSGPEETDCWTRPTRSWIPCTPSRPRITWNRVDRGAANETVEDGLGNGICDLLPERWRADWSRGHGAVPG